MTKKSFSRVWPQATMVALSLLSMGLGVVALYSRHNSDAGFFPPSRILLPYKDVLIIGGLIFLLVGLLIYFLQLLYFRADTVIRQSQAEVSKLAALVESSHDAMIGVDLDGVISVWNAGAETIFGYSATEIKGRPLSVLLPSDEEGELKNVFEKIKAGKFISTFETIHVRKDGEPIHVSVTKSPIKDHHGRIVGISVVAQDISRRFFAEEAVRLANVRLESRVLERTRELNGAIQRMQEEIQARKRMEKELALRAEELAASNRELEQFAVVASHDLQEPLRKVSSYGELLSQRYRDKLDEKGEKFIGYMVDGVSRMQILIKGLLSYGRVGRSDLEIHSVPLKDVVDQTLRDLEESIQTTKAEITCDTLPTVEANSIQMGQLLLNLISNAIKFSGDKVPQIHISARQSGDLWVISVKDNGIGIESQYLDRIFQIFHRLHSHKEFPGTGIGLAICKKIVDRYGGRIWVESTKGEGATFFFTLSVKFEAPTIPEMAALS